MEQSEIEALIRTAIASISKASWRSDLTRYLIPIRSEDRVWEYGKAGERNRVWLFADLSQRNAGLAYSEGGFAAFGCPWGIVNLASENMTGPDSQWYSTLEECLLNSGYFTVV